METNPPRGLSWAIFLVVGGAFFLWRSSFDMIWNDLPRASVVIDDPHLSGQLANLDVRNSRDVAFIANLSFSRISDGGYRPLSTFLCKVGIFFFLPDGPPRAIWIAFVSLIVGGFAACFYQVAMRFTQSVPWSVFALILVIASPAYACAAAVVFAGIQSIVLLLISASLLLYWSATDESNSTRRRRVSMCGLSLILVIGPWFREFIGLTSVLVGLLELQRHRKVTKLTIFCGFTLLHAVYPTFLVRAFGNSTLPLLPITHFGLLGEAVEKTNLGIRWEAGPFLVAQWPMILLLLAAFGLVARVTQRGFRQALCEPNWVVLWIWFLLSFAPFLRLFAEHVHLMYSLLPASILIAIVLRDLVSAFEVRLPKLRYTVAALVMFAACDQLTNLLWMHRATVRIIDGYRAVADGIAEKTRNGDVVVANFIGSEEIRYHGGGRQLYYYTVFPGVAHRERVVDESSELQQLLDATRPRNNVYFLVSDYDYLPDQANFHSHKYVRFNSIAVKPLGLLHETKATGFFLDPLKLLFPRRFVPFPASPDLMNDFYVGPDRDGRPFRREVSTKYYLYRVTGRRVDPWVPGQKIQMVEEGRNGFNILECNGRYFAFRQGTGPFDLARACHGGYGDKCQFDSSQARLNRWVDAHKYTSADNSPRLVETGYSGFNIIRVKDRLYAVRQSDGEFRVDWFVEGKYRDGVDGPDLATVKRIIDKRFRNRPPAFSKVPVLIESNYRGYNIILLGKRFYGIRQQDGAFDLNRYRDGRYRNAVDAAAIRDLKRRIHGLSTAAATKGNRQ